tara:strand:+ start:268 stop:576 length:309 start_codon:yes stop_codon:yes gene_type:complete
MAEGCPTCRAVEALLIGSRRVPPAVAKRVARSSPVRRADKQIRRQGKRLSGVNRVSNYSRKLSKHLRNERAKATKKNGDFKKGWDMARVMKNAHKCVKKEMK